MMAWEMKKNITITDSLGNEVEIELPVKGMFDQYQCSQIHADPRCGRRSLPQMRQRSHFCPRSTAMFRTLANISLRWGDHTIQGQNSHLNLAQDRSPILRSLNLREPDRPSWCYGDNAYGLEQLVAIFGSSTQEKGGQVHSDIQRSGGQACSASIRAPMKASLHVHVPEPEEALCRHF